MSAVSHVVTGNVKVGIKAETQERIRQAMRELGYQPSAVARALVRRQTDTLGVVLPPTQPSPLRDPYFSSLLDGVMQAATARHRDVMVFTAHPLEGGEESISKLRDGRCDGLILFHQPTDSRIVPALLNAGAPCVMIGDRWDDPRLPCVDVENVDSFRHLTEYLLGLGHRRIAFLSNAMRFHYVPLRLHGYRQALEASGIGVDETLIRTDLASWEPATVIEAVDELMQRAPAARPTAFCCTNDNIAALVLMALAQRGIRIPDAVSVAGFNDDEGALRQHPPLTTMQQPYEAMCLTAIDLIQSQLSESTGEKHSFAEITPAPLLLLPAHLVERGSTAPAPPI